VVRCRPSPKSTVCDPGSVNGIDSLRAAASPPGLATLTAVAGSLTASGEIQVADGVALPPNPAWIAPPLSTTATTSVAASTAFLYEGPDSIQDGVAPGTIVAERAAVVRGLVKTRAGTPLPGVTVTVAGHPEFGATATRADGVFDMVVNGGGSLVLRYTTVGTLPVDRRVVVPPGDFLVVADVVLIPLDPAVTVVDLTAPTPIQVAAGSPVTDEDGTRQARVFFPVGTTAVMRLPNGTTQPLTSLQVRATEYTVGPLGEMAMPAALPPTSAYTYAVDLSVDEALAAGAVAVEFGGTVPVYVDNFLGFPVGAVVPSGYYDFGRQAWMASDNGRVLKLLGVDAGGRATLDANGDAAPDSAAQLAALGVTDDERVTLATTYSVGHSVWRMPLQHFSPVDFNMPRSNPPGAVLQPQLARVQQADKSRSGCEVPSSIIECQDQVLGERLPVTGTPFSLNYRSNRPRPPTTGMVQTDVPLSGEPQGVRARWCALPQSRCAPWRCPEGANGDPSPGSGGEAAEQRVAWSPGGERSRGRLR